MDGQFQEGLEQRSLYGSLNLAISGKKITHPMGSLVKHIDTNTISWVNLEEEKVMV